MSTPPRRTLSPHSRAWLTLTLLLAAVAAVVLASEPGPRPEGARAPSGFLALGHRGARGLMPENSLPAFETALAIGVDALELDVRLTADGVPVVLHDPAPSPELFRDRNGSWLAEPGPPVYRLPLAELQAYDIGRARGRVAERFPAQQGLDGVAVPRLAEVLALGERRGGGQVRYAIETKLTPDDPPEAPGPDALATATLEAIAAAGVGARAMIQSFDWRSLALVQERAPEIPTIYLSAEREWLNNLERGRPGASPWTAGLDIDAFDGSVAAAVAAAGGDIWAPYYRDLRDGDIADAHERGLAVVVWTVNEPGDMARLLDDGVDGIITDYPDRLRQVMERKGLALPPRFPAP